MPAQQAGELGTSSQASTGCGFHPAVPARLPAADSFEETAAYKIIVKQAQILKIEIDSASFSEEKPPKNQGRRKSSI